MKQSQMIMGMPITLEIVDAFVTPEDFVAIFNYFKYIDNKFSTYKKNSEIARFNAGEIPPTKLSLEMKEILQLAEDTRVETNGYFNIRKDTMLDPSGIVKGWAIYNAAHLLHERGFKNFFIDAGGDIQVSGKNAKGEFWKVGIRNPFKEDEIIKVLQIENKGVATSGTYMRGQHIYNPHDHDTEIHDIVSITVIAPNIYDADRFATAAFAMGKRGIAFIQSLQGFDGYMIDKKGIATYTQGFEKYVL